MDGKSQPFTYRGKHNGAPRTPPQRRLHDPVRSEPQLGRSAAARARSRARPAASFARGGRFRPPASRPGCEIRRVRERGARAPPTRFRSPFSAGFVILEQEDSAVGSFELIHLPCAALGPEVLAEKRTAALQARRTLCCVIRRTRRTRDVEKTRQQGVSTRDSPAGRRACSARDAP